MTHLDTSFVIDLLREDRRGRFGPAHELLETLSEEPVGVSVFVICELEDGLVSAARSEPERAAIDALLSGVAITYPDERFAPAFARASSQLRRRDRPIAAMDLLIGVSALMDGASVATRNRKHFEPIPGLDVRAY